MNCKVKLKRKWSRHCILSPNGNDNDDANSNNIIFTTKDKNLHVLVITLSAKDNPTKNYQNYLAKDLKDQCIKMNIKQKVKMKTQQINLDIFLIQTL